MQGGPFGDPAALAEHARRVERLGYDELFTADHIGSIDPFIPLVVAACVTERLRFGPLVLNNELHHPALLARTAASFDQMSLGRLTLGLGTGYAQAEHDSIDVELRAPGRRVDRFGESLRVLRALLDEHRCDIDGEHHRVHIDEAEPVPVQQHVPFLIGGHGPRVVDLAGRHADIFQLTGLASDGAGWIGVGDFDVISLERRIAWLTESAQAAGRGPDEIERSALVQHIGVDDGAESVLALAERFGVSASVIEETPFVLNGTLDEVVDKLLHLRDRLGITHYVVRDPDQFEPVIARLGSA